MRRVALMGIGLAALAFGGLGAGGCNVGEGTGTADGNLFVVGCSKDGDEVLNYGERGAPAEYHLNPTFFAGDPIEDIGMGTTRIVCACGCSGTGRGKKTTTC